MCASSNFLHYFSLYANEKFTVIGIFFQLNISNELLKNEITLQITVVVIDRSIVFVIVELINV